MITEIIMLEFDCDECGNTEIFASSEDAKMKGWINIKPDRTCNSWINFCCDEVGNRVFRAIYRAGKMDG